MTWEWYLREIRLGIPWDYLQSRAGMDPHTVMKMLSVFFAGGNDLLY